MIKAVIHRRERDQKKALSDLSQAEHATEEAKSQAAVISKQFDELTEWANKHQAASLDAKRMILYHMIERVDVYRGYKLNITHTEQVLQFLAYLPGTV